MPAEDAVSSRAAASVAGASLTALALALPLGSASAHDAVLQNGLVFDTAATGPTGSLITIWRTVTLMREGTMRP